MKGDFDGEASGRGTDRALIFVLGAACLIGAGIIVKELLRRRSA